MKHKLVFLMLFFLSFTVLAQNRNIRFEQKRLTISSAMKTIERQTGFTIAYNESAIDVNRVIEFRSEEQSLDDAMKTILAGSGNSYKLQGNIILIVKESERKESGEKEVPKIYEGTVLDNENFPVAGAFVIVDGSRNATTTDNSGKFSIRAKSGDVLNLSIIGFKNYSIRLGDNLKLGTVNLQNDTRLLDEAVVVGYGTQKKVNMTGAVAAVSGDVLADRPIGNIAQGLQGLIPNLNVTFNSGKPDAAAGINIRGNTSLNGGSALILLDGVEISDLSLINPQDVESISVLKDASAAAVYGARAAFGVMLITSKQGSTSEKARVNYSSNFSWTTPARLPKMPRADVWCRMWNKAYDYDNPGSYYFSDTFLSYLDKYIADPENNPGILIDVEGIQDNRHNPSHPGWAYVSNTDWLSEFYRKSGFMQQHNLSLSGGNTKTKYYGSIGYKDQSGIFRHGNDKYNRFNATLNFDTEVSKWLNVGASVRMNNSHTDNPNQRFNNESGTIYYEVYRMYPTVPIYLPNGDFAGMSGYHMNWNVVGRMALSGRDVRDIWDQWYTGKLDFHPIEGLSIKADYTYNTYFNNRKVHNRVYYQTEPFGREPDAIGVPNNVTNSYTTNIYQVLNAYGEYKRQIDEAHNFTFMAGYNQEEKRFASNEFTMQNLYNNDLPVTDMAADYVNNSEVKTLWRVQGFFARFNYDYKSRYLLELNGRYDGSSKYAKGDRWAFFPSASAGWNIANEPFMENTRNVLDNLKLRGSIGSLGNQVTRGYHDYMSIITASTLNNYIFDGALTNALSTPTVPSYVTWEKVVTYDLGLEWGMFKNRLTGSFDYYIRDTKGMVRDVTLPSVFGTSSGKENLADLRTKGWEFEISWRDRIRNVAGASLDYYVGAGISDYQAVITKYDNPTGSLSMGYYKGARLGDIWGYVTDGYIKTNDEAEEMGTVQKFIDKKWYPGDIRYKDLDGNGKIDVGTNTLSDPGDRKVIGNSTPRYRFNFTGGLGWYGVNVDFAFEGVAKRDLWIGNDIFWGFARGIYNSAVTQYHVDNTWTLENQDAYYPRLTSGSFRSKQIQTKYLQNAAYLRLKKLNISYTLPAKWMGALKISNARLYFSGDNLWEVTGLPEIMTPDIADNISNNGLNSSNSGKEYAFMRSYSFGINITF